MYTGYEQNHFTYAAYEEKPLYASYYVNHLYIVCMLDIKRLMQCFLLINMHEQSCLSQNDC